MTCPSTPVGSPRSKAAQRDHIEVLRRASNRVRTPRFVMVHGVPGRARFRVVDGPPELALGLAARLRDDARVLRVEASPVSGSLLVSYEPSQASPLDIQQLVESTRASLASLPAVIGSQRPQLPRAKAAFDTLVLAATAVGA